MLLGESMEPVYPQAKKQEPTEQKPFAPPVPNANMRTKLQLYFKWGIQFEESYQVPERAQREVYYAGKDELLMNIKKSLYPQPRPVSTPKADDYMSSYGEK